MKKALISPDEITMKYDGTPLGARVAMVADQSFEIALPLFWVDCDDAIEADQFYWDGTSMVAVPPAPPAPAFQTQPIATVPNGGPNVIA